MAIVISALFTLLLAAAGLMLNLKMPNLTWTSEAVPIKQSAPVVICLFGGWGLVIVLAGVYYLLRSVIPGDTFAVICVIALAFADRLVLDWLKKKGTRILEQL